MGRPRKGPNRLDVTLCIRIDEDEETQLARMASAYGRTIGELFRAILAREWARRKDEVLAIERTRKENPL